MARRAKYAIFYARDVSRHVDAIGSKYHTAIREAIHEQLSFTPQMQTRNRKPLDNQPGPFGSTWELRCGPDNRFRVFYEMAEDRHEVWVLAIGVQERNRLFIGGKEVGP